MNTPEVEWHKLEFSGSKCIKENEITVGAYYENAADNWLNGKGISSLVIRKKHRYNG
jgi:hypothetical protein